MSSQPAIHISLEYKPLNSDRWESILLSITDYFDLDLNEPPSLDACPRHSHAIDYLPASASPLTQPLREGIATTRLTLNDQQSQRQIVETFWNHGKNRLIERTDTGETPYSETILEVQISEEPPTWEILRLGRNAGLLVPLYHAFLQENANGSQTETLLLQSVSSDRRSPLPETA